jgi:hypothetical protein
MYFFIYKTLAQNPSFYSLYNTFKMQTKTLLNILTCFSFTSNEPLFSPGTERQHFYEPIYSKDGLEHWTQYQGEFKKRLPGGRTSIEHFRWP